MIECLTQGLLSCHRNIYHSTTAYFFEPPCICRWHSAPLLVPPTQLWLNHFAPSQCSSTDLFLDSWMTANLTLNYSKTEFVLIRLENLLGCLVKYTTLHLTPLTLPEILASSLTNILLWPTEITSLSLRSLLLQYHIRQLRCIRLILIPRLPLQLLPLCCLLQAWLL